jgi:hypothetical protein
MYIVHLKQPRKVVYYSIVHEQACGERNKEFIFGANVIIDNKNNDILDING